MTHYFEIKLFINCRDRALLNLCGIRILLVYFFVNCNFAWAQDSAKYSGKLGPAYIEVKGALNDLSFNDSAIGDLILTGKKSEIISITKGNYVVSEKIGRQVFAKIPGAFVYDMDGTGNQLNIAFRGLDPHRGWEFTNRKDGILTNTDMYGYPASHFSTPLEIVDRIEIVRGTGSLQYGAQFGGMLNYVTKAADSTKPLAMDVQVSGGSFRTASAFARIHGTSGRWSYQFWAYGRSNFGFRRYTESSSQGQSAVVDFRATSKLKLRVEWSRSQYLVSLPGPLTDSMFYADPTAATRTRNYYSPDIRIPSFQLFWNPTKGQSLVWRTGYLTGERNSVMFDKPATIPDTVDYDSFRFAKRQVDRDRYRSLTTELKYNLNLTLAGKKLMLTAGAQYMRNRLHRRQLGKDKIPFTYSIDVLDGYFGRDLNMNTNNLAVFFESNYQFTKRFTAGLGVRYESGKSEIFGRIQAYPTDSIPTSIQHKFPLLGGFFQYRLSTGSLYGGFSQAYRPVIFKDIIPTSVYEFTDKQVKDAFGYNTELGIRGNSRGFSWDICAFLLRYNNRLGSYVSKDSLGNYIVYKTNIGNSSNKGLEFYFEYHKEVLKDLVFSIYTSTAFMQARYTEGTMRVGQDNVSIQGNTVESVPQITSRNGIKIQHKKVILTLQYSFTGQSFSDPLNTIQPNATGSVGLVPSYQIWDASATMMLKERVKLTLQCNNILNNMYFTKRPQFYPGPGIWPSDGRAVYASLLFSI